MNILCFKHSENNTFYQYLDLRNGNIKLSNFREHVNGT